MVSIPFSEARAHLTEIVNLVLYRGKRFVLKRSGKNVAAIVSLEDLEALEAWEEQIDLKAAKKADKEIEKHGTIEWDKAKKELNL